MFLPKISSNIKIVPQVDGNYPPLPPTSEKNVSMCFSPICPDCLAFPSWPHPRILPAYMPDPHPSRHPELARVLPIGRSLSCKAASASPEFVSVSSHVQRACRSGRSGRCTLKFVRNSQETAAQSPRAATVPHLRLVPPLPRRPASGSIRAYSVGPHT